MNRCLGSRPLRALRRGLSIPSATLRRSSARSLRGVAAQPGKACCAASTAASTSGSEPAEISAIGCSSIGEMSVKVASDLTRSPPIQCRVSTSTPSTVAVVIRAPVCGSRWFVGSIAVWRSAGPTSYR